jgi:hypothetical protein
MPSPAELLRMKAERERRQSDQSTAVHPLYAPKPEPIDLPQIVWPVKLLLPWSYLVSDNARYGVVDGKLLLTKGYRRCKGQIRELARAKLGMVEAVSIPLRLEARVWVPDEMRAHDVCNFAKCCHDALQTVVYANDRWLWDTRWIHVGVDVDAPRCELTILPLAA